MSHVPRSRTHTTILHATSAASSAEYAGLIVITTQDDDDETSMSRGFLERVRRSAALGARDRVVDPQPLASTNHRLRIISPMRQRHITIVHVQRYRRRDVRTYCYATTYYSQSLLSIPSPPPPPLAAILFSPSLLLPSPSSSVYVFPLPSPLFCHPHQAVLLTAVVGCTIIFS